MRRRQGGSDVVNPTQAEVLFRKLTYKSGRVRYEPTAVSVWNSLPIGFHLVRVDPGHWMTMHRIDPDCAGFLAAAEEARTGMLAAMRGAAEFHAPTKRRISRLECRAWDAWAKVFEDAGERPPMLVCDGVSLDGVVQAGLDAVRAAMDVAK